MRQYLGSCDTISSLKVDCGHRRVIALHQKEGRMESESTARSSAPRQIYRLWYRLDWTPKIPASVHKALSRS
jgi:hypothetical protein